MEKIRILNIVYSLNAGGVQALAMNILRHIDRGRFQMDFLVVKPEGTEQFYDEEVQSLGSRIFAVGDFSGGKIKKYMTYERGISEVIRNGKYDVVHINSGHIHTLAELISARRLGVPNIITHSHNSQLTTSVRYHRFRCIIQGIYRHLAPLLADHLLTCSDLAAEWAYSRKAIRAGRVIQINNGIVPEEYAFSEDKRRRFREQMGFGNELVIGHIGRFNVQKNHGFLIDIFSEIKKQQSDTRLVLCGDGELKDEVRQRAEKLGVLKDISFPGVIKDVPSFLSGIDVFVFPSLFEGLPVVGIEAQAAGVPVLASDEITDEVAVTPVWHTLPLSDGAKAWADAAVRLYRRGAPHEDTCAQIREAGFDIRNTAAKLTRIYADVKRRGRSR